MAKRNKHTILVKKQPIRGLTRAFKPLTRGEGLKIKRNKRNKLSAFM